MQSQRIIHPFDPVFSSESKILILGTLPSPKSREVHFYYGNPQNRFWRILADLFNVPSLNNIEQKKEFLYKYKIALWDVLASCDIKGADDSSIKNAVPNNLNLVIDQSKISTVFTNGQKAAALYKKYFSKTLQIPCFGLPSTSPANCRNWTYDSLKQAYKIILDYL